MIELGRVVKDIVTGFEGVAVARSTWLFGCVRVGIEPRTLQDKGKAPDAIWVDEQRVEYVETEKKFRLPITPPLPEELEKVKLGNKVQDQVTGFKGMATALCIWYNGQVVISVEPQELHEGKPVDTSHFEVRRLNLLEPVKPKVSKESSATSGGPQKDFSSKKNVARR